MSQPAKPPRRKRPTESHFVGKTLADKWDGLASRRKVSFAWDGSGYMSTRTQNIDEMTMLPYAEPLKALLEVAPSGFPSHKCLVDAFEELHNRYEVLNCDKRFVLRAATLAAENWKIMTNHLYNVALNEDNKLNNETLQELVKLIKLPDNEDSPSAAVNVAAAAALPALPAGTHPVDGEAADAPESGGRVDMDKSRVMACFPDGTWDAGDRGEDPDESDTVVEVESEAEELVAEGDAEKDRATWVQAPPGEDLFEVELCGMLCNCPACQKDGKAAPVKIESSDAEEELRIPSPEIGGQKRETKTNAKGNGRGKGKSSGKERSKEIAKIQGKPKGSGKGKKGRGKGSKGRGKGAKEETEKYTVRMRFPGVPRPRRLRGKQPMLQTPPKEAKKVDQPAKVAKKGEQPAKVAKESNVAVDEAVALPTTKVVREPTSTRRGEAYLLDANKKYILGVGSRRTAKYAELVEIAMEKFNDTTFENKGDAKAWLDQQIDDAAPS